LRPDLRLERLCAMAALLGLALAATTSQGAGVHSARISELRGQAEVYERQALWDKAGEIYETILRLDRTLLEIKNRYQHCLRRAWQVNRHRDEGYRKDVLGVGFNYSLRLYDLLLDTALENSLDKRKIDATRLFRKGLEELRFALSDAAFRQAYLPDLRESDVRRFRDSLQRNWGGRPIRSAQEARDTVHEVAVAASTQLNLDPTIVVMEFLCGACYGLDEYSAYLSPAQLRELCEALKGEFVGIGVTLGTNDGKLIVAEVAAGSPAAEKKLMPGDRVVMIDKKVTLTLAPETALELLEGPSGSTIDLVVDSTMGIRAVTLQRRPVFVPSVAFQMRSDAIGYIQITSFQETTIQELDVALGELAKLRMKALVLDLRGNRGGLFDAAIESAKRFLSSGVIASTQNSDSKFNTVYQARSASAITVPMVVLIDSETASAAEILAGALKENGRARLIGKNTFGKGCTQTLLGLPPGPSGVPTGGLRLTITRYFSPTGQPYTGRGVAPHLVVERLPDAMDPLDAQLAEALLETHRLLDMSQKTLP
jgi:carboxyl-terminal processing protease